MQIQSNNPVPIELERGGGCVVTGRVDYWRAAEQRWELAGSSLFQQVTKPTETQEIRLPGGLYNVVFTCRAEESINGMFSVALKVNGTLVATTQGNVDTTSSAHDSAAYKNQFILTIPT